MDRKDRDKKGFDSGLNGYIAASRSLLRNTLFVLVFSTGLMLQGCATVITGRYESVSFDSSPQGARVAVNGQVMGTTPTQVTLHRGANSVVAIEKDGYAPKVFPLTTKLNPYFWLDIALLSPLGVIVDFSDSAASSFDPATYAVQLAPAGSEANASDRRLQAAAYISSNYDILGHEIFAGEGEHLESLMGLLYIEPADRSETVKVLLDVYETSHSEAKFSAAVLKKFGLSTTDCVGNCDTTASSVEK